MLSVRQGKQFFRRPAVFHQLSFRQFRCSPRGPSLKYTVVLADTKPVPFAALQSGSVVSIRAGEMVAVRDGQYVATVPVVAGPAVATATPVATLKRTI
jgi:hypothetical protein